MVEQYQESVMWQVDTSMKGTQWGTGGMTTKLTAARIATAAGCRMVICLASEPENVMRIMQGERLGTVFHPHPRALRSCAVNCCQCCGCSCFTASNIFQTLCDSRS